MRVHRTATRLGNAKKVFAYARVDILEILVNFYFPLWNKKKEETRLFDHQRNHRLLKEYMEKWTLEKARD